MSNASRFSKRILMVGCGSVGQGLLPLLLQTLSIQATQLTILTADERGRDVAAQRGVRFIIEALTAQNYAAVLSQHLTAGDLLLNLSVDVSSQALISWCRPRDVLYLDTCVEPWVGGYLSSHSVPLQNSNTWLRQQVLALHHPDAPTAVIAHGMNPGLISHLLKEALVALAQRKHVAIDLKPDWAALAQTLGVKAIHLSEHDTQDDGQILSRGEFANTWSAQGLYSEAWLQGAEVGWGSHEVETPLGALYSGSVLHLPQSGANIRMRTWLPTWGEQQGYLITHHEVASITEMLSTGSYCPTVCYVYSPCPKAQQSLAYLGAGIAAHTFRVLDCNKVQGIDEIGVLLIHDTGALWHGSTLRSDEAQRLAPHNSATSLQVVAGIVGALAWMFEHPRCGVVEAEDMDSAQILNVARPWLGDVKTVDTDWSVEHSLLFQEFLVTADAKNSECGLYSAAINAEEIGV
ncbi:MAG: homospermidine synthase [Sideroxydans sp.]|nr:homospermidine synthase [Sideroxydans sp.]